MSDVPGYNFGDPQLPTSPVSLDDFRLLEATVLWSDGDEAALRRAGEILIPQTEAILDLWYGFVGSHAHLVSSFAGSDGAPDGAYLSAVRARFARWIADVCTRDRDQTWLDHQHELALRHHHTKKNATDGIASTSAEVPMRYLVAFVVPITVTIEGFLRSGATDGDDVTAMMSAWFKAVTLTVALWTKPYAAGW